MATTKNSLKKIYKIHSTRLANSDWNLKISRKIASKKEIISLADSQIIDFIHSINKFAYSESEVKRIKKEIKAAYKNEDKAEKASQITKLFAELDSYTFIDDLIEVVMDKNIHFDRANKGFFISKLDDNEDIIESTKYLYLVTTTNGGKNSTAIYASEKVHSELNKKMNNGRNLDKLAVPAKIGAYQALITSSSTPLSFKYKPHEILVVKDCHKDILANVILIGDSEDKNEPPKLEPIENHPLDQNINDGFGLVSVRHGREIARELGLDYLPSFQVRGSFCKGMLFNYPFKAYAKLIAKNYMVLDAWGKDEKDIRKVKIILSTSMLKLWDSYDSIDHYLECCEDNGYSFRIAKVTPKILDDERDLSYQFIQPLELSDRDIDELIKPTISEIKEVQGGDYRKSILYLSGENQTEKTFTKGEYDCVKALKVDRRMIFDPFVKNTINKMISKRINNAKMGELRIRRSNYQTVAGDPQTLLQNMFKMDTVGLLQENQFYSKYFNDLRIVKTACFRAPMTSANNIRLLPMVNTEEMQKWYKYMDTVTIFNSHDATMNALNGQDADGDSVFQTDLSTIINAIEVLDPIVCEQKTAKKIKITSKNLRKAAKASFGDDIGIITNRTANMINLKTKFEKDSLEYIKLDERIKCGQLLQQNSIDKSKGIISKPMPKWWYDWKVNKISPDDSEETIRRKEFNMRILADKSPYFLIYRYPHKMKKWKIFKKQQDTNCWDNFGCDVEQLITKREQEKIEELVNPVELTQLQQKNRDREDQFIKWYHIRNPISLINSTMNRICFKVEEAFEKKVRKTKKQIKSAKEFDYSILMTNSGFDEDIYLKVEDVYEEYMKESQRYQQLVKKNEISKEDKVNKSNIFREEFKRSVLIVCNGDVELLTNIVVEMCYRTEKSKQFAWDLCGTQIVKNLLSLNNFQISFPIKSDKGDFTFKGEQYVMVTKKVSESEMKDENNN